MKLSDIGQRFFEISKDGKVDEMEVERMEFDVKSGDWVFCHPDGTETHQDDMFDFGVERDGVIVSAFTGNYELPR
jgi:hypothetical protein